jgi:outer membrane protein assembly factor BamB
MAELPPLIIGSSGYVAAINPMTGEELWRTALRKGLLSGAVREDVSVIVSGEVVFAGSNGHLFCLSATDGALLWTNELKGMGYDDVSLAMAGISVQFLQKVVQRSGGSNAG